MEVVDKSITEFIREVIHELEIRGVWGRRFNWLSSREASEGKNIESYLEIIFELEAMVELNLETPLRSREKQPSIDVNHTKIKSKISLSFYHDITDTIPIYKDAILLEDHKPLVSQEVALSICHLLKISGTKEGVEVENHNFGYHFHYYKIEKRTVEGTSLLLTFDPTFKKTNKKPRSDLFGEYRAEGKNMTIDTEIIGDNRRYSIYLAYHGAGQKKGLSNFEVPSNKSKLFIAG